MPEKNNHKENTLSARGMAAIVLAGGLGTRLREAVPDLPKCMAAVAGRPFLYYVINYLRQQGVEHFIFSLGYKHEVIERYLKDEFPTLHYQCVIETEPLGTGGAIQLACTHSSATNLIVTNGDTIFKADLTRLLTAHLEQLNECTLALKPMRDFDRYGVVYTNEKSIVTDFKEKQHYKEGLINGGLYVLNREQFLTNGFPQKFSFEKDFLEKKVSKGVIGGLEQDAYFIDIGIPEDYNRAQSELKRPALDLSSINKNWTLFLDRDGVINEDKPGSYIFNPDEFVFMHGAPALFTKLTDRFGRIFVATNQRGVGRGLMTNETLNAIHKKMTDAIENVGGRIDAIYSATAVNNNDPFRKPNPGMALDAKAQFPSTDLSISIMIGNNISDMGFGRSAEMFTVFLRTTNKEIRLPHPDIDLIFDSLEDFAKAL